jgi:hypothetical protein
MDDANSDPEEKPLPQVIFHHSLLRLLHPSHSDYAQKKSHLSLEL